MRFAPQFGNLPASLPAELYVKSKVKPEKPKILDSPNVDQQQLIRSIARLLPERIWLDPMVFPQRDIVLRAISQLSELDPYVGSWLDMNFSCVPISNNQLALFNKSGETLVLGHSGEVMHYAAQFCRRAIPAIVNVHRMGFVAHPNLTGILHEDLQAFRTVRSVSKGLNRVSKLEELDYVDQDKTINKFVVGGLAQHPVVYHLGAGTNTSSSQRPLHLVYKTVVLVDPRLKSGHNSLAMTWEEVLSNIPANADIVSDVAYGDEHGMILDGFCELVTALYQLAGTRLVMVKLPLQYGYKARGSVHCKPRPHNLECVVILDPEGDHLDDIYDEYYTDVVEVNKERNRRILCMAFSPVIKDVYNTSSDLADYMNKTPPALPSPFIVRRTPKKSRNKALVNCAKKGVLAKRHTDWYRKIKDPEFDWNGPAVSLPPSFLVSVGSLGRYDPGLPDIDISLRSARLAAIRAGFEVSFVHKQWQIC